MTEYNNIPNFIKESPNVFILKRTYETIFRLLVISNFDYLFFHDKQLLCLF